MPPARVSRIVLKAGARPDSTARAVDIGPVTVLVGPNNAGKSAALRDLAAFARGASLNDQYGIVVERVDVTPFASTSEVNEFLATRSHRVTSHHVELSVFGASGGVHPLQLSDVFPNPSAPQTWDGARTATILHGIYTTDLNGRQRFNLAAAQGPGPLDGPPTSHWMAVERDAAIFAEVDAMIHAALEQHLVIQTFRHTLQPALSEMALPSEHR